MKSFPKRLAKLTILAFPFLAGCQGLSLENSIGIDETDNGVLCANVEIRPVWTKSTAVYSRIEMPKGAQVTPEQLAQLVAACNQ